MSHSHRKAVEPGSHVPMGRGRRRAEQRRRRNRKRLRVTWAVATGAVFLGAATAYAAHRLDPADRRPSAGPAPSTPAPAASMNLTSPLAAVTGLFGSDKMSVALLDTESGKWATYGGDVFDTASIVKVDILSTLLLQAQDARRKLTTHERDLATDMIENSDNDATSTLWTGIGEATGLDSANKRLGLKETTGAEGTAWGLTRTTAVDQVRLLAAVFGEKSPLDTASRTYIQQLMYHIAPDQDWGVSAAADPGRPTALKNGWLQRSQTHLWDVNSIGRVETNGRVLYAAVLMNGCSTEEVGIRFVEQAARSAATAFARTLT
ncbi:serine hydrolase [Streptomyces fagopyri]